MSKRSSKVIVVGDLETDLVYSVSVPSMTVASQMLSLYAIEAPNELDALAKIIRVRR